MPRFEPKIDPHKIVAQIGAGLTTSNYEKNQDIFVQGEAADSVHFIQEGRIKTTVTSEHGKEAVVGIFGKGQFFGEGCLTDQSLRTATMECVGRLPNKFNNQSGDDRGA
jgi:CRP/FNR family transcriptional regulator, cyclic AMP receptor protein